MSNILKLINIIRNNNRSPFFGFIGNHLGFCKSEYKKISLLVGEQNPSLVEDFELTYSKLVGNGKSTSFATGRMGFFALLQALDIGSGDEVILQGASCAVMANAILRRKATPIYADIDIKTFGSCAKSIDKMISTKTKMIIAQHSFGIPCDILPIIKLARSRNIFLLEDCALTFGSSVNNKIVGNFGDAALFSCDHTKPINTLVGGLIYTSCELLHNKLQGIKESAPEVETIRQKRLFKQLCLEAKFSDPKKFGRFRLLSLMRRKIFRIQSGFFDDDFGLPEKTSPYNYPLRLPPFLAQRGIKELQNWSSTQSTRIKIGKLILKYLRDAGFEKYLTVYSQQELKIVPLRIAFTSPVSDKIKHQLNDFLDCEAIWFREPLEGAKTNIQALGYIPGSCPISEKASSGMINFPCNMTSNSGIILSQKLEKKITALRALLEGENSS
jgi:dTDP-4-amino-4,6-dideoxygalactose transaminase